jgi:hypothetical protein
MDVFKSNHRAGGVAQGEGLEFKPQYRKKKRKKRNVSAPPIRSSWYSLAVLVPSLNSFCSTALVLGFDWGKFLKDHSYKAAPVSCFKHVSARAVREELPGMPGGC